MILHYFSKKENKDKDRNEDNISSVYVQTINSVKRISLKKYIRSQKDFDLSFEITSMLLFCIFFAKKITKVGNKLNEETQILMDLFVSDIDHSLRLAGIGDMSIGKYVKSYVKKFYFRVSQLEFIFLNDENNMKIFKQYLLKFNIIKESGDNKEINEFLLDLQDLIKRCNTGKIDISIYSQLFK